MGQQTGVTDKPVRYWPRPSLWPLKAMAAAVVAAAGIGLIADGLASQTASSAVLVWLGVVLVASASSSLAVYLRPALILADDMLRIPRGRASRPIRIPVEYISGVGLIFVRRGTRAAPRTGWYLKVWREAGAEVSTGISYAPSVPSRDVIRAREKFLAKTPGPPAGDADRRFRVDRFDPVTETDPAKLAATYAGQVARHIYDHVLARQGPSGPLAVDQQQKHVRALGPWALSKNVAFWSPDGVIGRIGAAPARHWRIADTP